MSYWTDLGTNLKQVAHNLNHGWHTLLSRASHAVTQFTLHPDKQLDSKSIQWGVLSCELTEDDEALHLKLEVPGMNEADFNIELNGQLLTVSGERKFEKETREKHFHLQERAYGSFTRQFQLPEEVNADTINASYKKGVLSLYLPKIERTQKRIKIPIKTQ